MSNSGFLGNNGCRTRPNGWDGTVNLDTYSDPDAAPFDKPLSVEVRDAQGPYRLKVRCMRTAAGWVNAATKTRLAVPVTGWKY